MEASLRATLRFDVVAREDAVRASASWSARSPRRPSPGADRLDEDLDLAVQNCVRAAIGLLEARYGMDPRLPTPTCGRRPTSTSPRWSTW